MSGPGVLSFAPCRERYIRAWGCTNQYAARGRSVNSVFVTGTDTDIGKTFVAAGLAALLRGRGAGRGGDEAVLGPVPGKAGATRPPMPMSWPGAAGVDAGEDINPVHQDLAAPPYAD